jgi:hypothetical protein
MVLTAVMGTCALVLLIATAIAHVFLSFWVYIKTIDSRKDEPWEGQGGWSRYFVGIFSSDDWSGNGSDAGYGADSMKTASRVFLCLAVAMGLVSVGLMWFAIWPLCWMPKPAVVPCSEPTHGPVTNKVARTWSAATIAAALCVLTGSLVFVIFGADECSTSRVTSNPNEFTTKTTIVGYCDINMGSSFLCLSLILWIVLVAIRKCVAPIYRADEDVAPEVATFSEGDVAEDSPEIRTERV